MSAADSAGQIGSWIDVLGRFARGEFSVRLDTAVEDAVMERVRVAVNDCLAVGQTRLEAMHHTSMELAMGVGECFSVLAEMRKGNFEALVSADALGSSEELVAKLGSALNETVKDIRLLHQRQDRQEMTIRELAVPILQIWEGVILAPLIGTIDSRQAVEIMEKVLRAIVDWKSQHVILDLTGVEIVDTRTADHLIKIVRSAQILGARCILT
ncbi:MAG: STAS domain-containing protein, partial [Candidatus Riflebacteria bacterium]|nr:STAS domain-containing protein [Candidatus Riflebacteria bacterium]